MFFDNKDGCCTTYVVMATISIQMAFSLPSSKLWSPNQIPCLKLSSMNLISWQEEQYHCRSTYRAHNITVGGRYHMTRNSMTSAVTKFVRES